jgi:hypothetical protein
MRTRFTCPCGASLEVEAESWFLAQRAAQQAGWQPRPQTLAALDCPKCVGVKFHGHLDENA